MVKQRQVWVKNYSDLAKQRMDNNECPACGKPKSEWTRRTDWACCSKECSEKFYNEQQSIQSWETTKAQAFKRGELPPIEMSGFKVKSPLGVPSAHDGLNPLKDLVQWHFPLVHLYLV